MILNFDIFKDNPEAMVRSLMESTQMAFDTLERKLKSVGVDVGDDAEQSQPQEIDVEKIKSELLADIGDLSISGDLTVGGHSSQIGAMVLAASGEKSSVAKGTSLVRISNEYTFSAGSYIIFGNLRFGSSLGSTPVGCAITIEQSLDGGDYSGIGVAYQRGRYTYNLNLSTFAPIVVPEGSTAKVAIFGYQNSATMNVEWYMRAMRVA